MDGPQPPAAPHMSAIPQSTFRSGPPYPPPPPRSPLSGVRSPGKPPLLAVIMGLAGPRETAVPSPRSACDENQTGFSAGSCVTVPFAVRAVRLRRSHALARLFSPFAALIWLCAIAWFGSTAVPSVLCKELVTMHSCSG